MATDSISGLQKELEAALAVLDPEIRGVNDLARHPVTDQLRDELNTAESDMQHRRGLIQTVLDDIAKLMEDLQTLEADGYPTTQTFVLDPPLQGELDGEVSEVKAGAGVFKSPTLPAGERIDVSMSAPHDELPAQQRRT